jgi:PKD domain
VTFTVTPPPVPPQPAPPEPSFKWFPPVPQTGEPVSLVSTSTDAASPITAFAWALTSNGPFQGGGAALTTSFSTPGGHPVRLRVTNAYGLSSVATETINVVGPRTSFMQPFPVVRIVGTETASGVKLRLLRVQQMPARARITVRCKGRGCPIKSARRIAVSKKRGVAPVEFRRFERFLRFGITLEILISKPGEIGKYTRFAIRRGKLPERLDMCLDPAGVRPLVCPSS